MDNGFLGYTGLLGGELPAASNVTVKNFVDGETDPQVDGTTDHGTSVAEIVTDVAPDAELYLAKIATVFDLEEAEDWLTNTIGVDVISTSLGFVTLTPGDGTGRLADLVAAARSKDALWATAAGNFRERHWSGSWNDPNANQFINYNGPQEVNYFGPGDGSLFNINSGFTIVGFLRWSDWGGSPDQDYALHLIRFDGQAWQIVATSDNAQTGGAGQSPVEIVVGTTSGAAAPYGFAIERNSGIAPVNFDFFTEFGNMDERVAARSLIDLADAPDALTSAGVVTGTFAQTGGSSEGPTNGPGGVATGGLQKPNVAGYSPVSTATNGTFGFTGTSAAAPHAAGAAVVLRSFYPHLDAESIMTLVESRSVDVGVAGIDTQSGSGRVDLGAVPPDEDGDGILDDGDSTGVSGDGACTNGNTSGCDDNCVLTANASQATADNDGLGDACDNCTALQNGPAVPDAGGNVQLDIDGDLYGNMCECDFDNDGFCSIADFNIFLPDFQSGQDSGVGTDMNGDGAVSIGDFNLFLPGFQAGVPGPSAFAP